MQRKWQFIVTSLMLGFALFLTAPAAKAQQGPPSATVGWTAPSVATPSALSYKVQRATSASGPFTQVAAPTTTSFVDTAVTRGTTYFYRVFTSCPTSGAGCGTNPAPIWGDSTLFLSGNATIPATVAAPPPPQGPLTITAE